MVARDWRSGAHPQAAVLDGLAQMRRFDPHRAGKIGDRACDTQDAMVGARRQAELVQRAFEQGSIARRQCAVTLHFAMRERGIRLARTPNLQIARGDHASAHTRTGLAARAARAEFDQRHARYLDLQIDAIEERTGDARTVAACATTSGVQAQRPEASPA